VKRHITNELLFLANDTEYLLLEAKAQWPAILGVLIAAVLCFPLFLKWHRRHNLAGVRSWSGYLLSFLIMAVLARGGVQMKPIAVIDAYRHGNGSMGNLILNGMFSASHYSISGHFIERKITNEKEYLSTLGILEPQDPTYPLEQKPVRSSSTNPELNLVVIMVESLSAKYIDGLSGGGYGITPELDKLITESRVFTNFFANGQRSVDGVQSILTGVPPLPGIPDMTALTANYPRLGNMARANDIRTVFVSSTNRESFSLDLIAKSAGFNEYFGREDYPLLLSYPAEEAQRPLGWDYEAMMYLLQQLQDSEGRFFGYINASSDHTPFAKLQEPFTGYEHGTDTEGGYLNMLHYTDWAIGKFIEEFKQHPQFDDTVFIITADHAMAHFQSNEPYERFRIPLLIYSPKHVEPGISENYGSQIDLLTTIVDLLELEGTYSSIGSNLLEEKPQFAVVKEGALINIFSPLGFLQHSLGRMVHYQSAANQPSEQDRQQLEEQVLAFDHLTYLLLTANRWQRL
ncbi:MAG: LTA synthase family protein, partial [bacterium]